MRTLQHVVDTQKGDDRPVLTALCECGSGAWIAMLIEGSATPTLQCGSCRNLAHFAGRELRAGESKDTVGELVRALRAVMESEGGEPGDSDESRAAWFEARAAIDLAEGRT